jgi:c-di-GMP-binding flagellar brake protein YcgR
LVDILHRLIKGGDLHMMTDQVIGNGLRWGQRISVNIPVQVAAQASPTIRGRLKSISLSGALMEADHELRLHAYIEVSIKLPETGRSAIRVMARVMRKSKEAVGVEWCEFAPSTIKDLLLSPSIRLPR